MVLERTVRELQGIPCIGLDDHPSAKKQIACTRSFGKSVENLGPLMEAVSEFASRAAEKLRAQQSVAGDILVFIRTSPFRQSPQYSRSIVVPLGTPTSDSAAIVDAALRGLREIYRPGFQLAKAGVMLMDLRPASHKQCQLDFGEPEPARHRTRLMDALDSVNERWGKGTLKLGSAKVGRASSPWVMKQERRTPGYTTAWEEMPIARL